ncbi:MAG: ferredoxin--NADP reductase [Magnetococcales bacterium]|nr:ferredoxin--NADP reductase [Magnetococcales bacterium]
MAPSQEYNATLAKRLDISARQTIFRIKPDQPVPFVAGQFTVLGLKHSAPRVPEADPEEDADPAKADRLIRRAYSISSGSHEQDFLEFYLALVSDGKLTPRLFQLREGDRLFVGAKATGVFTLDRVPPGQKILLVGTGTGLAPYISMVRTLALGVGCPAVPLAILHGAAHSWDLGYRPELEMISKKCSNFQYAPIISRPEDEAVEWRGRTGRLTQWLTREALTKLCGFAPTPGETHIFLCGNPGLVEEALATFQGWGFDPGTRQEAGNLHVEKYW